MTPEADAVADGACPDAATGAVAAVPRPAVRTAAAAAVAVAVLHAVNDAYMAFLHPLLPRIMDRLGLSITLAAALAMTLSIASSVVQPAMGWLADRFGRRPLAVAGPVLAGVFLSLIGTAPNLPVLALFLVLGGIGSAAFHPPGASIAGRVSEGRGSGLRMSFFSFSGAAGYAAGPLIAVGLVGTLGLAGLWVAMLPVLLLAPVLYLLLPAESPAHRRAPPRVRTVLALLRGPLGLLFGISAIGAFLQRVFLTMQPIAIAQAGGSEALGAFSISAYLAGQAAGSLTGGLLADRVDRRRLLATLSLLSFPAHLVALGLAAGSPLALAGAATAGLLNMALLPPIIIMAQEIAPEGAAVTSGVVMGLAWAVGSLGVLATGGAGDVLGPRTAALLSTPIMLVAVWLAWRRGLAPHGRPAMS